MNTEEIISWILKALVIPLLVAGIKGRDMFLELKRTVKDQQEEISENHDKINDLEEKRAKDLVEYSSVQAIVRMIDTMVDNKLSPYFKEAADQRHRDNEKMLETFGQMRTAFEVMANNMTHMRDDINVIKTKDNK